MTSEEPAVASGVRLISDGTTAGTHLEVDGVRVPGIVHVDWDLGASGTEVGRPRLGTVTVKLYGVEVQLTQPGRPHPRRIS